MISGMARRTRENADWREHAQRVLKLEGHRGGGARAAVIDLLAGQDCCLTAQEIFDELRADGRTIGIASVYRALELLSRLGLVRRLEIGASACYEPERPSGEHHHHVVCERCGKVAAFEDRALEEAIERLARRHRYAVGVHEVTLRGSCPDCRAAA
jgi:Fur family transcriptional regulator, ferric uptake regulator